MDSYFLTMESPARPMDPYDWSIDDVVHAFCSEHRTLGRKLVAAFNLHKLEQTLRENHVSGNVLLTECHKHDILKNELGMVSLGQRSIFSKEVLKLADTSEGWRQENMSLQNVRAILKVEQSPAYTQGGSLNPYSTPASTVGAQHGLDDKPLLGSSSLFGEASTMLGNSTPTQSILDGMRARSPLTILASTSLPDRTSLKETKPEHDLAVALQDQEARPIKKRKIAPQFLGPVTQPEETLLPEPDKKRDDGLPGYLGQRSLPINQLFYDDTPIGAEVRHKDLDHEDLILHPAEARALRRDTESGAPMLEQWPTKGKTTEIVLYIKRPDLLRKPGRSLFVDRRMKHFLLQSDALEPARYIQTNPRQSEASGNFGKGHGRGIIPYQERLVKDTTTYPSMTIFSDGRARRVRLHDWKQMDPTRAVFEDELEELRAKWTNVEGSESDLPLYGHSGSEGNVYSDSDEDEEDLPAGLKHSQRPITDEEVITIIEEESQKFIESWRISTLPQLKLKAFSLWQEARNTPWYAIQNCEKHLKRLEDRLGYLTSNIMGNSYDKAEDVRRQCGSFEVTIADRATTQWKLELYEETEPPPRPRRSQLAKLLAKAPREAVDLGSDEEDLLNDEEIRMEENYDDFVDDSSDEMRDSSPEPDITLIHPSSDQEPEINDGEINDESSTVAESVGHDFSDPEIDLRGHDYGESGSVDEIGPYPMDIDDNIVVDSLEEEDSDDFSFSHPRLFLDQQTSFQESHHESLSSKSSPSHPPTSNIINLPNTTTIITSSSAPQSRTPEVQSRPNVIGTLVGPEDAEHIDQESDDDHVPFPPNTYIYSSDMEPEEKDKMTPSKHNLPSPNEFAKLRKLGPEAVQLICNQEDRLFILAYLMAFAPKRWKNVASVAEGQQWSEMIPVVWDALERLKEHHRKIRGLSEENSGGVMQIATWFVAWFCRFIPSRTGLKKSMINQTKTNGESKFQKFWDDLESVLLCCKQNFSKPQPTTKLSHKASFKKKSGDVVPSLPKSGKTRSTRKWKKREVTESQEASDWRQMAAQRQKTEQKRREVLLKLLEQGEGGDKKVIINAGKDTDEDFIEVNRHIASRIKPHQIEGINFIWREVVRAGEGVLLAHDMGLGKTMQCIAALVTIAEAAKSQNINVQQQIPESLRTPSTIIVCPPSLVDNWYDELLKWVPEPHQDLIGDIRMVNTNLNTKTARLLEIEQWYDQGGVLLMPYSILAPLVTNKERESKDSSRSYRYLTEEEHQFVCEALLERPNLVIADEAQHFKNPQSNKSQVMQKFKTKLRIALTGSPLANNLAEYFHILDWASKGYLGKYSEFREEFEKPISQGIYKDAEPASKRKALLKLKVLEEELSPKVHRANYGVLKSHMHRKTEFLIYLSPTNIQKECYDLFTRSIGNGGLANLKQSNILAWIGLLKLICNHPSCFSERFKPVEGNKAARNKVTTQNAARKQDEPSSKSMGEALDEVAEEASHESVQHIGLSDDMIKQQRQLFNKLQEKLTRSDASQKMVLLFLILHLAKKANEKTLVFSHSLPTLNYVEEHLSKKKYDIARIDGATPTTRRQEIAKKFNEREGDVLLISTMAGGAGLNLFGASRVVILDDSFNPMNEQQAIGRAYRIGQTRDVFVYRLFVAGSFEEQMQNQGVHKLHLAQRVVDNEEPVRLATQKMGQYVKPLQARETKSRDDLEVHTQKDPHILQKLMTQQENLFTVQWIVEAESFLVEEKEELTATEAAEATETAKMRRLRRTNPRLYQQRMNERQQAAIKAAQPSAPTAPFHSNPSGHQMPDAGVPLFPPSHADLGRVISRVSTAVHEAFPSVPSDNMPQSTLIQQQDAQSAPDVAQRTAQYATRKPPVSLSGPTNALPHITPPLRTSKMVELSKALKAGTEGQAPVAGIAAQIERDVYQRSASDADYLVSMGQEIDKARGKSQKEVSPLAELVSKEVGSSKVSNIELNEDVNKPHSPSPLDLSENQRNTTGRAGRMQAVNDMRKEVGKNMTATEPELVGKVRNSRSVSRLPGSENLSADGDAFAKAPGDGQRKKGNSSAPRSSNPPKPVSAADSNVVVLSSDEDEDEDEAGTSRPKAKPTLPAKRSSNPTPTSSERSFQMTSSMNSSRKRVHVSSSEDDSAPNTAQKPKNKKGTKMPKHDVFADLARKKDKDRAASTTQMAVKNRQKVTDTIGSSVQAARNTPDFGGFMGLNNAYKSGVNRPSSSASGGD